MAKKKNNYVDNKKLYGEMLHYINELNAAKAKGLPKEEWPRITNYIGEAIYLIAHNLAKRPNFSQYSFREEMVFDGIENCIMYLHNFNPDKYNNPFSYFTTIIYYAFLRRIEKEEKQSYIKYKLMNHSNVMNNLADTSSEDDSYLTNMTLLQIDDVKAYSLIEKFEPKTLKGQPKKKAKGVEVFIEEESDNEADTDPDSTDD